MRAQCELTAVLFISIYKYTEPTKQWTHHVVFWKTCLFYAPFHRNLNCSFMASVFKFQTDGFQDGIK